MGFVEIAARLTASLDKSAALLGEMAQGLRARRSNWISSRPSALAEPSQSLAGLAQRLDAEEQAQQALIAESVSLFPALTGAAGSRRVRASDLCDHLPAAAAARLRKSADKATAAGKAVRRELALGERLLRFTKAAHDSLVENVSLAAAQQRDDVGSYDRNARRLQAALPRTGSAPGSLVDGRI